MNKFYTSVLGILALLTVSCSSPSVSYRMIEVSAPFSMPPIKLPVYPDRDFLITDFGAVRGDEIKNSEAIARAIDACHRAGGGRVVIPPGTWLTGAVHLKSNVNLHLEDSAILLFSDDPYDYLPEVQTSWEGMECFNYSPLIYAYQCENVSITGKGTLKPVMAIWKTWFKRPQAHLEALAGLYTQMSTGVPVDERRMAAGEKNLRPHLIHFNRCKNILLDGFMIRESPFWTIHLYMCESGVVRNLDVRAHGQNNDGIDFEMSRNFLVENCTFDQGDDAVVIKSGRNHDGWRLDTPCENIVIRQCNILAGHTLLAVGSEISGGVRNIYMHDCKAPRTVERFFFIKTNHQRGGFIENIFLENMESGSTQRILEIDTEVLYQWRDLVPTYETRITRIDGIYLTNVNCERADAIFELKGDRREPIRNVTIENVHVNQVVEFVSRVDYTEGLLENKVTYGNNNGLVVD